MAETSLEHFVTKIATRFQEASQLEKRMPYATAIAQKYKFECPELVFFYTHPELSKLRLSERCEKIGITEEQYHMLAMQTGFQKFISEWQQLSATTLHQQASDKIGIAITKDRSKFDKNGNEIEDYEVEMEILKQHSRSAAQSPQVNIQVNNLWDRARAQARHD